MPYGFVTRVTVEDDQTEVTAAAISGATSLTVDWPGLFDAFGSTVDVNGTFCAIDSVNEDTGVLTLIDPTTSALDVGDPVYVVSGGQRRTHRLAHVDLGEGDDAEVRIPYGDRDLWPTGDYDEPVPVLLSPDCKTILETPGRVPSRDGTFISANTVTADKIVVGIGENRITNAGFEDNATGLPHVYFGGATFDSVGTGTPHTGTQAGLVRMPTTAVMTRVFRANGTAASISKHPRVSVDQVWRGEIWVRLAATATGRTARAVLITHDAAGTNLDIASGDTATITTTWTRLVVDLTVVNAASRVVTLALEVNGTTDGDIWRLDDLRLSEKVHGELIVNGTVITDELKTGEAGAYVLIKDDSTTDDGVRGVVKIFTEDTNWLPGEMYGKYSSGTLNGILALRSPYLSGSAPRRTKLELRSNAFQSVIDAICDSFDIHGDLSANSLNTSGQLVVGALAYFSGAAEVEGLLTAKKTLQAGVKDSGAFAAAGDINTIPVTFSPAFDAPPAITFGIAGVTDPKVPHVDAASITASGFNILASRTTGTGAFDIHWQATAKTQ